MNRIVFKGVIDGVVVDRITRDSEYAMPSIHFHPEFEVYYLLDGAINYFIENKTYLVKKGSLVLINAMQLHRTSTFVKATQDRILIELAPEPFSGFFENICGMSMESYFAEHAGIYELTEAEQDFVEDRLFAAIDEFERQPPYYQSLVMLKIAELLLSISRCEAGKYTFPQASMSNTPKYARIYEIIGYILENYNKVKSLDEISKRFFINKSYLCRTFKEVTGSTVQDYININCVKKARELLEGSDMSVSEIASFLGYGSVTYFERMFRRYMETSPLKYRKKMRLIKQKVRERKKENGLDAKEG